MLANRDAPLGNADAWAELLRTTSNKRERRFYEHALGTLDRDLYAELWAKYGDENPKNWLNLTRWLPMAYRRCKGLGLVRAAPLDMLDLACGAGHVGYVARYFGHRAIGLDKPTLENNRDLDRLFGGERIEQVILPMTPLNLGRRFDLITSFSASFHMVKKGGWTLEHWDFFLDNVMHSLLSPGGRIYLRMNDYPSRAEGFVEMLARHGCTFDGKAILFNAPVIISTTSAPKA